jgi:hypothetical protein
MLLYKPNTKTRAQQSITNKKTIDNDENQNNAYDVDGRLHNSHGQGITAAIHFGCQVAASKRIDKISPFPTENNR